jgi:hypothetical protein
VNNVKTIFSELVFELVYKHKTCPHCRYYNINYTNIYINSEGSYFDAVQPYQHHNRNPYTYNVYSFDLRPEEHHPSRRSNYSRI